MRILSKLCVKPFESANSVLSFSKTISCKSFLLYIQNKRSESNFFRTNQIVKQFLIHRLSIRCCSKNNLFCIQDSICHYHLLLLFSFNEAYLSSNSLGFVSISYAMSLIRKKSFSTASESSFRSIIPASCTA